MKSSARYFRLLMIAFGLALASWLLLVRNTEPHERGGADNFETLPRPAESGEEEGTEGIDWFYAQRAYPLSRLPVGARMRAITELEHTERELKRVNPATGISTEGNADSQGAWMPLGSAPIKEGQTFGTPKVAVSGRVSAIALDPGYDGTANRIVYIGAAQGGLWRSPDNGANWIPLTDDQPSLAVGAIAIGAPYRVWRPER
jgi:hypothetical protein